MKQGTRWSGLLRRPVFLSFLSAAALLFAFPRTGWGWLGWIALAPFLTALRRTESLGGALRLGFLWGFVFLGASLVWLNHVAFIGWLFVVLLELSFTLLFVLLAREAQKMRMLSFRVLAIACAWTLSEWARSEIPVFGFGWNLLAHTQAFYPLLLQTATVAGAYGLGFVMVLVNAFLAEGFEAAAESPSSARSARLRAAGIGILLIFTLVLSHGFYWRNRGAESLGSVRLSLIQGNIPQSIKWEVMARDVILQKYLKLTELASFDEPDLIVWPEAAFPGYWQQDPDAERVRELVAKIRIPLLFGSPRREGYEQAYNSAFFLDLEGRERMRHDKLLLVPFGEYVPMKTFFGWLEPFAYSMGVSNFEAGTEYSIFEMPDRKLPFAVLICFEDVFPSLARRFADKGALFLVVMTNDAWFGRSAAPFQHLQASVLRAVESGLPVVRAANTGVSALISSSGEILRVVTGPAGGALFETASETVTVPVSPRRTLYRAGGWLFPYGVLIVFVIIFAGRFLQKKR